MLRCRRCRRSILDSTCLSKVEATDGSSSAVCSIWHVNIDTLPEWILTSVHTAQWTVGKLNCQNCAGRLGGFNFVSRSSCPCGLDATVHLNKSRVDHDHKRYVLIVRPRRTRPEKERAGPLAHVSPNGEPRTELNSLRLMSHISSVEASNSLPDTTRSSFSPPYCISHRRRCSAEVDSAVRPSCFCPGGLTIRSAVERASRRAHGSTESPVLCPASQQFDRDGEAPVNGAPGRSFVPGKTWSPLDRQLLQTAEDIESSPETAGVHEEVSVSDLSHRGGSISDSGQEPDEEVLPQGFMASTASSRLSKREKNRLKSLRRKQRRRERWLHSQLEQTESVSAPQSDSEGVTCAVCLEVYFSPYSCQPCGHVFCEPCLRTIAKNRPTSTPCPLCRTLISHTTFHKELNQTAETFFPKVYAARRRNFQNASCAKWSLPSCRKRFRSFWGEQRQAAGRRWHFVHGGFTLEALDFADMRGWLFYIGLVIVYIHSVNWIMALLFLFCLIYYYLF
ncbi:uncharacterized protein ACO6RY_06316 [Pungitius sinensis]